LQYVTETVYAASAAGVVKSFLQAINNGDALTFWRLLDRQGQGYFMGMWFYALGNADLETVSRLAQDDNFLRDALVDIVTNLKSSLGALLDSPQVGKIQYQDSRHAVVPVSTPGPEERPLVDYIPLVLELAPGDEQLPEGNAGMTCWRIDTLKCFQVKKTNA